MQTDGRSGRVIVYQHGHGRQMHKKRVFVRLLTEKGLTLHRIFEMTKGKAAFIPYFNIQREGYYDERYLL